VSVRSYVVTGDDAQRMAAWMPTAMFANWIEGRKCGDHGDRETWLVTCFDEQRDAFLAASKAAGVTVEEIEHAGDAETYKLLVGEPGTGWTPPSVMADEEDREDAEDDL
jgi:hypothetical protein